MKQKLLDGKKIEWLVWGLFVVLYIVIASYHEPWFDEAEAWQIAKCASLREILFEIPHFEGHPPLWHLILAIPAKLGVPFEIGLKSVGFILSAFAAYLMLFHSKIPRPAKLIIPFTYFFFYQYGIVVRPYGLMLIMMILIGMNLNIRKEKPWLTTILLGLLCLTCAYGILFAGGIAICILWEIVRDKGVKNYVKQLFSDNRSRSLFALFCLAILLAFQLIPHPNAYGTSFKGTTSIFLRLFCAFFTFPVDCFLSTSTWFGVEQVSMQTMNIPTGELLLSTVLGIILWILLICSASKRNIKFFIVPYSLYTAFAAIVYFSTHHMGVVFLFVLCWAEFISRSDDRFEIGQQLIRKLSQTEKDRRLLKQGGAILCAACLLIPLYWCGAASVHEIQYEYCFGRSAAQFIKKNNLENALILCPWNDDGSRFVQSEGKDDYINPYVVGTAIPIVAYFENNIVMNLNHGDNDAYVHHRTANYEEGRKHAEQWRTTGIPDIIVNHPKIELVYGDEISYEDYSLVWENKSGFLWKNVVTQGVSTIYVRNDLLEEYGLEPLEDLWYSYWINGVTITQEMRDAYANGVPIDEIIDPILDQMFGPEE